MTRPPDDIDVEVEYEFEEDADGNRRLRFTSPYSNHFIFRLRCVDEDGEKETVRLECSSNPVDEDGEEVTEGDTGRPHAGSMRLLVCGVPLEDTEAERRLRDLLREAVRGMGAFGNPLVPGRSAEDEDGNDYQWADWWVQQSDLSPEVLEERLEVIADHIGGEVRRDGSVLMLQGPGPCLMD